MVVGSLLLYVALALDTRDARHILQRLTFPTGLMRSVAFLLGTTAFVLRPRVSLLGAYLNWKARAVCSRGRAFCPGDQVWLNKRK